MGDTQDWSSSSNDAVQIRLRHKKIKSRELDVSFSPAFTYPIFGDEETIFGYKGLRIRLDFAADSLSPSTDVSYSEKYAAVGDTVPDAIDEKLEPFLPTLNNKDADGDAELPQPFEPPGELLHQYEVGGRTFGVWTSLLSKPETKRIVRNMQILIPMFIEGGVPIELDDPDWTISRWRVFLVYAIDQDPTEPARQVYSLAGYCTTYRLYFVTGNDEDELVKQEAGLLKDGIPQDPARPEELSFRSCYPSRERISQFLILPPYQAAGHGSRLYGLLMRTFVADPTIRFVTVEDPNESFDDMRDVNDLVWLRRTSAEFRGLRIDTDTRLPGSRRERLPTASLLDRRALERIRTAAKMVGRQFGRLVEMHLLSQIPAAHRSAARLTRRDKASDAHDRAYYFWRLLVKQRLTLHNRDALAQLEVAERIDKLDATLEGVERDYGRLLELAARRQAREEAREAAEQVEARESKASASAAAASSGTSKGPSSSTSGGKAKRVIDESSEEDENDEQAGGRAKSSKRPRLD